MRIARFITILACLVVPSIAAAQQDSARATPAMVTSTPRDSLKAPLSPRRAFLYSFALPGFAQSKLGRHKAAAAFLLVEGITITMIRESAADVRQARRFSGDSLVLGYTDATGSTTSRQVVAGEFGDAEVHTRRAHVEDWVALLVANHLFAGADAFVAAHLWDVPIRLALQRTPDGTALTASIKVK